MLSFRDYGLILEEVLRYQDETRAEFVRRLIYSLIDIEEGSDCDNVCFSQYQEGTWKAYLSRRTISNIALDILKHYDPVDFTNMISELEGNAASILLEKIQPFIIESNIVEQDLPTVCDKIMNIVLECEYKNSKYRNRNKPLSKSDSIENIDNKQRSTLLNKMKEYASQEKPCIFISYACTNFNQVEKPVRITSIVVNIMNTSCERTFDYIICNSGSLSGLKECELDEIERRMLDKFFEFATPYRNSIWIHWNMRNSKYGFEKIINRYCSLGGVLDKEYFKNEFDLAWAFKKIYGSDYVKDPRFENICKLNGLAMFDFEKGENEAVLFEHGKYDLISHSKLRKIHCMTSLFDMAIHGTLKTQKMVTTLPGG